MLIGIEDVMVMIKLMTIITTNYATAVAAVTTRNIQ
jgi:hypothetical protein